VTALREAVVVDLVSRDWSPQEVRMRRGHRNAVLPIVTCVCVHADLIKGPALGY
jgi:hypothetical protein